MPACFNDDDHDEFDDHEDGDHEKDDKEIVLLPNFWQFSVLDSVQLLLQG